MQYLSSNPRRSPDAPGENLTGADVRYQSARGLTAMLSAQPDFSGVDAEVAGVGFSYTESTSPTAARFSRKARRSSVIASCSTAAASKTSTSA